MICDEAKKLIKFYEGCKLNAYECATSLSLPKAKKFWTIGYGSTTYTDGSKIKPKDTITQKQADELFDLTLATFEKQVKKLIKSKLNDNQMGALVSFAYNVGTGNLKSSTLLKLVNAGDFRSAVGEFGKWNKSNGKVLNGLVTRRNAEAKLFLTE